MSFAMTTPQFKAKTKTVTRRFGWWFLKPGDRLRGIEKGMGLAKGEKVIYLGLIEIVSCRREPLNSITEEDCIKEGFPHLSPVHFVAMLVGHYGCPPDTLCNRIEYKYV